MEVQLKDIQPIIEKYRGQSTGYVALLQDIQNEYRYLPREALEITAEQLDIPLSRLYSMATFYKSFYLEPRGKHEVHVCMGTACHVRGALRILERLSQTLGVEPGETTENGEYTLETVNCVGACALGPLVTVDGRYFGQLTPGKSEKLIGRKL